MHEIFSGRKYWLLSIAMLLVMLTCTSAGAEACSHCGSGLFKCAVCGGTYILVDDATIKGEPIELLEPDTANITYGGIDSGMRVKLVDYADREVIAEDIRGGYFLYMGPSDRYQGAGVLQCLNGHEQYVTCLWLARDDHEDVWAYIEYVETLVVDDDESVDITNWGYIRLSDVEPSYHQMLLCALPFEQEYGALTNQWYAWIWPDLLVYASTKTGYAQPRYGFSTPLSISGGEGKLVAKSGDWYMIDINPALLTIERGWPNGERLRYWVPAGYVLY